MQLINILPVANSRLIHEQPMYMFLTHLVHDSQFYLHEAQKYRGYKILDNSLIEMRGAMNIDCVLHAASLIGADEIILPDVFQNGPETLLAAEEALKEVDVRGYSGKIMAVCQGSTPQEFKQTFRELNQMPIDVIGIPKVLAKLTPRGRPEFEDLWLSPMCTKEIHLLGIWYAFSELRQYAHPERIRSVDSCLAAYFAFNSMNDDEVRADGMTLDLGTAKIDEESFKGRRF